VSVKFRAAPPPKELERKAPERVSEPDPEFLKGFCRKIEQAGASWITLHPRTAAQKRRGEADWSQIASVKRWLTIPVIGNGDVQTPEDVRQMFEETGCDRVMVGRTLLAKPWLLRSFSGIGARQGTAASAVRAPDPFEEGALYGRFLGRVLELMREHYAEPLAVRRFRYLAYFGCPYLEFGHTLYSSMKGVETFDGLAACLSGFFGARFDRPQKMSRTTSLRF
jgi:tRNA-dihydrouridine synthase